MRLLAFLHKTFLENLRDWKILCITLLFGPFFVYLMWGYFEASAPAYRMLERNPEAGQAEADAVVAAWKDAKYPDQRAMFVLQDADDPVRALQDVKERKADLFVEVPEGFSARVAAFRDGADPTPARVVDHADAANIRSSMALAMADYVAFSTVATLTNAPLPLDIQVVPLGGERTLSDFDLYVPALLVLAVIMVMFPAAATLVREVDRKTMVRLMLSRLSTVELLAAVSINQVLIGVVSLALAYGAAVSVGYHAVGSIFDLLVVGALSTLGVVALSVIVSAFLRTIFELLTVGTVPFFVLMFFSDCFFPLPKIRLFDLASHPFYLTDLLPTALTVRAVDRILNAGASLCDVGYELIVMAVLTAVYFAIGGALFRWRHMRG